MTVVIDAEAAHGLPAWQTEHLLGGVPRSYDLDVADASLDLHLGLQVVVGLAEVNLSVRPHHAKAAEVDELVALDRGPAALVLPAAHLDHDVHLSMLTGGIRLSQGDGQVAAPLQEPTTARVHRSDRGSSSGHRTSWEFGGTGVRGVNAAESSRTLITAPRPLRGSSRQRS